MAEHDENSQFSLTPPSSGKRSRGFSREAANAVGFMQQAYREARTGNGDVFEPKKEKAKRRKR